MSTQLQDQAEQIAIAEENERERESLFQLYEQNIGRHGLALHEIGQFSKQVENSARKKALANLTGVGDLRRGTSPQSGLLYENEQVDSRQEEAQATIRANGNNSL